MTNPLPHSEPSERGILSAALSSGTVADEILEQVTPEQFHHPAHRETFATIAAMRAEGRPVDLITLTDECRKLGTLEKIGGEFFLTDLATAYASVGNWREYATAVSDCWKRRELRAAAIAMVEAASDYGSPVEDTQEACERILYGLRENTTSTNPVVHCRDHVVAAVEHIEKVYASRGETIGLSTGIVDLDRSTGGFLGGQMVVIAARPACGKSALGMQFALHAVQEKSVPTLVFSVEMPGREIMLRALCSQADINLQRIRDGFFNQHKLAQVSNIASHLIRTKLFIDETPGLTVAQFRSRARRAKAQHKIGLIVVDYLQFMHGSTATAKMSRALEVSEISKAIKQTAKELDIPIIALAQLNRDAEGDNVKPKLSNLRESGSIEQDADVVLLIHRIDKNKKPARPKPADDEDDDTLPPEPDHNTLLILAKQRNGPTPEIKLRFIGERTVFENVTEKQYSNNPNHRQK